MSMKITEEEYLQHYGVPGMKWGKRKARAETSSDSKPRSSKKARIVKGAAVAGSVLAVGGLAYATRNTPQATIGRMMVRSSFNVAKEGISNKVGSAQLNSSMRRANKLGKKNSANSNNPFNAKNIYDLAARTSPQKSGDKAVKRMLKKNDAGRSAKDVVIDEAARHGAKMAAKFALAKVKRKIPGGNN